MDKNQEKLLGWIALGGLAAFVLYKLSDSFGSLNPFNTTPSYNATDPTAINPVWNETAADHRKYTYTMHASDANDLVENIYTCFGAFNIDFSKLFAYMEQCKTQGDIFQLNQFWNDNYDSNFWASLQDGFGLQKWSGLDSKQLKQINDYVESLPL